LSRYADTSFLASLYSAESGTALAINFLRRQPLPVLVSSFAELELHNAVNLRLFRKEFTVAEAEDVRRDIEADFVRGLFLTCPLPDRCFERAQQLSQKRTKDVGTRAGDILHVAIALELKAEWFLTFDKRQQQLAKLEGLRVIS